METKNTTDIQLMSLDAYMQELGYKRTVDGLRYEFIYPVKTGERFISLRSAVKLHNTRWVYHPRAKLYSPPDHWCKANTDSPFKLAPYEYEKSQARKIVEWVHLQKTNDGRIVTQSHVVKFVSPHYYEQFLETSLEVSGDE